MTMMEKATATSTATATAKKVKKMFAKIEKKKRTAKAAKVAKKVALATDGVKATRKARGPNKKKHIAPRVAQVTQTKTGGLMIQFYNPEQLRLQLPSL